MWLLTAAAVLVPGTPVLDPPTLVALGVQLPITGDDDFDAVVGVRYRVAGTQDWHDAMPLYRVHAEVLTGVDPAFAGSIFDLAPDTDYEIELHATDPDGLDQTFTLTGHTRPVPGNPANPNPVAVTDAASLADALANAQPGDVISLADGTYAGPFVLDASGTAADPIVIRGYTEAGTVLDGGGCTSCNTLEIYGSYVHVENLTIAHANRGLRFQGVGATDNVVRRVTITDVTLGIGSNTDQADFYIADNVLEGRLAWPCVYTSDDPACNPGGHGQHANDDGIHVEGSGHVVAHNRISGFGDAMKTEQDMVRSVDFYGNDVLTAYDNGLELDGSAGNTRALRNRFTNTFATMSFQPIFGGPAYAIRNVIVNVADEQFKLHARGTEQTVGAVMLKNTIVRGVRAVQVSSADVPLYFTVRDNLFIGPASIADGHTVRWDVPTVDTATIDHNGYYPDGQFEYGYDGTTYPSFADVVAAGGFDATSVLLDGAIVGTDDWTQEEPPTTPIPAPGSAGEGLGAIDPGCVAPTYGPRAIGVDETNETFGCGDGPGGSPDAGPGGGDDTGGADGGCCQTGSSDGTGALALVVALVLGASKRRAARRNSRAAAAMIKVCAPK